MPRAGLRRPSSRSAHAATPHRPAPSGHRRSRSAADARTAATGGPNFPPAAPRAVAAGGRRVVAHRTMGSAVRPYPPARLRRRTAPQATGVRPRRPRRVDGVRIEARRDAAAARPCGHWRRRDVAPSSIATACGKASSATRGSRLRSACSRRTAMRSARVMCALRRAALPGVVRQPAFRAGQPWIRRSRLHRPGVIRTNERPTARMRAM